MEHSSLQYGNVTVHGRRTGIKLEPAFWEALTAMAAERQATVNEMVESAENQRVASNVGTLTSAVRVMILEYYRFPPISRVEGME